MYSHYYITLPKLSPSRDFVVILLSFWSSVPDLLKWLWVLYFLAFVGTSPLCLSLPALVQDEEVKGQVLLSTVLCTGMFYNLVAIIFILTWNGIKINGFFPRLKAWELCFRLALKSELFPCSLSGVCLGVVESLDLCFAIDPDMLQLPVTLFWLFFADMWGYYMLFCLLLFLLFFALLLQAPRAHGFRVVNMAISTWIMILVGADESVTNWSPELLSIFNEGRILWKKKQWLGLSCSISSALHLQLWILCHYMGFWLCQLWVKQAGPHSFSGRWKRFQCKLCGLAKLNLALDLSTWLMN